VLAIYILLPMILKWAGAYFSLFYYIYFYGFFLATVLTYG
jgi:hypothetical protein